jgi:hypothetical protein
MRRQTVASKRAIERRERENAARRLNEIVPELQDLSLRIVEVKEGNEEPEVRHVRRIVVDRAPALFDLPCSDLKCDGGHDVTRRVMNALKRHKANFEGQHRCNGHSGEEDCVLELRFVAEASYAP